ncbi:hypothetical protein HMPREF1985_02268 [Mitsuokella sp. oral taxon 131 str. W9106]|nr:hypothetical protein HMPREF1985_02268 [Mitsuokella sp. oral taxon 131 str. W9106]
MEAINRLMQKGPFWNPLRSTLRKKSKAIEIRESKMEQIHSTKGASVYPFSVSDFILQ